MKKMVAVASLALALSGCAVADALGEAPPAVVDGVVAAGTWIGKVLFSLALGWLGIPSPF